MNRNNSYKVLINLVFIKDSLKKAKDRLDNGSDEIEYDWEELRDHLEITPFKEFLYIPHCTHVVPVYCPP